LGDVSTLSGPIADIYSGAVDTEQAFVKYVNARGGIDGRKLVLKVLDDGLSPTKNAAATRELASQVFAFIGSVSGAEDGGIPFIKEGCIPDIGSASTQPRREEPTYVHNGSQGTGVSSNIAAYAKKQGVKRMAFLVFNDPSAIKGAQNYAASFKSEGIATCYFAAVGFGLPDYTANVVQMKQNKCDGLSVMLTESVAATIQMNFQQQNFHPKFVLETLTQYVNSFPALAGGKGNVEGLSMSIMTAPVDESQPAMNTFKQQLKKYYPKADPHGLFAVSNWADSMTFAKALQMAGKNPTRVSLMNAFSRIHNYNAGGIVPTNSSPLTNKVNPCMVMLTMKNGKWIRSSPSSGFDCSGKIFG
jgi:ABC-type branched-subunit amino acid transport system substrate-binding protein